jgi:ATP-binding cassette subfamily C protein
MRLLQVLARAYPRRTAFLVGCLMLAGLAEGIGLSSLVPLLGVLSSGDASGRGAEQSRLGAAVVDSLGRIGIEASLGALLALLIGAVIVKASLMLLASKQVGYAVAHMSTNLRLRLIRALLRTRWEFFIQQRVGAYANAIASEVRRASQAYLRATTILALFFQTIVYAAVAFWMSWKATLGALVAGTIIVFLVARLVRMARRAGNRQTKLAKALLGRLTDTLLAVKPIKAMGREMLMGPLLESETQQLNRALEREVLSTTALDALYEPLIVAFLAAGLYVALVHLSVPAAEVLMPALLCARIVERLGKVQKEFQRMVTCESAFWAMRDMIADAEGAREVLPGAVVPSLNREIALQRVTFGYDDRFVLHEASLIVPAGELTVIVGPSGAGKTTIADLIIGLVQPQQGDVLIDGVPLRIIDAHRWRGMVGYVPQDAFLLHESVHVNVTLGDPDLSPADVEAGLRAAGAWEFVAALPEGTATVLGERGLRISGGQRQRIALARALVRRPKLLVLDEATTALDPATEAAICATLDQHRGRLTILAICHHGALVNLADRLYRVEAGTIVPVLRGGVHGGRAAGQAP